MSDMVERVAKAISTCGVDLVVDGYEPVARAAIKAMRTPVQQVQDRALHDLGNPHPKESKQWLREYFAAMIDAALEADK